jgi:ribosomal protein L37AE/L43A
MLDAIGVIEAFVEAQYLGSPRRYRWHDPLWKPGREGQLPQAPRRRVYEILPMLPVDGKLCELCSARLVKRAGCKFWTVCSCRQKPGPGRPNKSGVVRLNKKFREPLQLSLRGVA